MLLINPLLKELDLKLHQHQSNLYISTSLNIATTPCFKLKELPLKDCLAKGHDKQLLDRLFAEFQMSLSQAPFNILREQKGLPLVNTLWLWGEGDWNFSNNKISILTDSEKLLPQINRAKNITSLSVDLKS